MKKILWKFYGTLFLILLVLTMTLTSCSTNWQSVGNYTMAGSKVIIERQQLYSGFDGVNTKDYPCIASDGKKVLLSWGVSGVVQTDTFNSSQFAISTNRGNTFSENPQDANIPSYIEGERLYHFMTQESIYSKKHKVFFELGIEKITLSGSKSPLVECKIKYCLRDKETYQLGEPKAFPFPFESPYPIPYGQAIEYENGDFLLLFYYIQPNTNEKFSVVAIRYSFDGENFAVVETGTPLVNNSLTRGYCEPSVVKFGDMYYMTIRSDENAYLAWSNDGLNYSTPTLWKFDDGSVLGSCNTQQRLISHEDDMFLVYTRFNGENDHVMRNRAPLYMAKIDETNKCLIKDTEVVLVTNRGASLANTIGICKLSKNKTLVFVIESMLGDSDSIAQYGADNSVWLVKITSKTTCW